MLTAMIVIFVVAYAAIALEHPLKINKSASALIGAGLLWTIYALSTGDHTKVGRELGETVTGTAQIIFFLMGAMTIVEVVDAHNGFEVITQRIRTTKLSSLMWLVGIVTFFLSSILDNLTTTIVMISLMRKLLAKHDDMFAPGYSIHELGTCRMGDSAKTSSSGYFAEGHRLRVLHREVQRRLRRLRQRVAVDVGLAVVARGRGV